MTHKMHKVLVAMAGTWLIAGCGTPAPVEQKPAATAPAPSAAPVVMSPVSINAEMVSIIDHAGHELWNAEREGKAPKTKADWENLAEHATQLAAVQAQDRRAHEVRAPHEERDAGQQVEQREH